MDFLEYHILRFFRSWKKGDALTEYHKGFMIFSAKLRDMRLNDVLHKVLQRRALEGGRLKFFRVSLFIASSLPRINVCGITRAY